MIQTPVKAPDPNNYLKSAIEVGDAGLMAGTLVGMFRLTPNGIPAHAGSGVLVEVQDRLFVATAGHFKFTDYDRGPFFYRHGESRIDVEARRDPDILSSEFTNDGRGYDLGYIELDRDHSLGLKWGIPVQYFSTDQPKTDGFYFVQGISQQMSVLAAHPRRQLSANVGVSTLPYEWLRAGRDGHHFDYGAMGVTSDNARVLTPEPWGLSGGPVWSVKDLRAWDHNIEDLVGRVPSPPGLVAPGSGVKLVGIQSGYDEEDREAYVVAASNWLIFLALNVPELGIDIKPFV